MQVTYLYILYNKFKLRYSTVLYCAQTGVIEKSVLTSPCNHYISHTAYRSQPSEVLAISFVRIQKNKRIIYTCVLENSVGLMMYISLQCCFISFTTLCQMFITLYCLDFSYDPSYILYILIRVLLLSIFLLHWNTSIFPGALEFIMESKLTM